MNDCEFDFRPFYTAPYESATKETASGLVYNTTEQMSSEAFNPGYSQPSRDLWLDPPDVSETPPSLSYEERSSSSSSVGYQTPEQVGCTLLSLLVSS